MNIVGIIPARGGSKGIPSKNTKRLYGKPLIAWTILTALKSSLDRVIISTDDPKIREIAKRYGAEAPFLRPTELAGDKGGIEPVLKHTVEWLLENEHYHADIVVLLLPTSPLRQSRHIDKIIDHFIETDADSVVSVSEAIANNNPYWMLQRNSNGKVILANGKPLTEIKDRRQELPPYFIRNDLVYILKKENLYEKKPNLYGKKVELFQTEPEFDVDINNEQDWLLCQFKMKQLREKGYFR